MTQLQAAPELASEAAGSPVLSDRSQAAIWQGSQISRRILANRFYTIRDINDYFTVFTQELREDLFQYGVGGRWLDAGAGEAIAMREVYTNVLSPPEMVALGVRMPEEAAAYFEEQQEDGAIVYHEDYIENVSVEELGSFHLITDLYGPMSYSAQPDVVLEKYMELLEVGGSVYYHANHHSFQDDDGHRSNQPLQWLRAAKGIRVKRLDDFSYKIEKVSEETDIPSLEPLSRIDGTPPFMEFILRGQGH